MERLNADPIPFYRSRPLLRDEQEAILDALRAGQEAGGGPITLRTEAILAARFRVPEVLLCTSGTHALELLAHQRHWSPGEEIILPSFTHPSTANAFVRAGATLVFADSSVEAPHLCAKDLARRITSRTRAVIVVHYAGGPYGLSAIEALCREANLLVYEDAAQSFDAQSQGRPLGTIGAGAALSFHQTKNLSCGEGGLYVPCSQDAADAARIAREMGTNRFAFRQGLVPSYDWVDDGSSYLPSELLAALLEARLRHASEMLQRRVAVLQEYFALFQDLSGALQLPLFDADSAPNGHSFFLKLGSAEERAAIQRELAAAGIETLAHYRALHATPRGQALTQARPTDLPHAITWRDQILRLPTRPDLESQELVRIREVFGEAFSRIR